MSILKQKKLALVFLAVLIITLVLASATATASSPEGNLMVWHMDGTTKHLGQDLTPHSIEDGWKVRAVIDMNNSGDADIVWQSNKGGLKVWFMNGLEKYDEQPIFNIGGEEGLSDPTWEIMAVYDLNNSGSPDIIWQNIGGKHDGQLAIWFMDGLQTIETGRLWRTKDCFTVNPSWQIGAVTDLFGNGSPEVIWQAVSGEFEDQLAYWELDGFERVGGSRLTRPDGTATINSAWQMSGAHDLTGNGRAEIIFHGRSAPFEGALAYWRMDGSVMVGSGRFSPDKMNLPGWAIVGTADVAPPGSGQKVPTIFWQNEFSQVYQDYRELLEFTYIAQKMKVGLIETLSNGYDSALLPPDQVDDESIEAYLDLLTEAYEAHSNVEEALARLGKSDAMGISALDSSFSGIRSEQTFFNIEEGESIDVLGGAWEPDGSFGRFFYWVSGSGGRNRDRILSVVSNIDESGREKVFQHALESRVGYRIEEDNANDFWLALEGGKYDMQAAVLHNDLYHAQDHQGFTCIYWDTIDKNPDLKARPIDVVIEEGTEGIEAGCDLYAATAELIAPGIGQGYEYAQKVMEYGEYVEKIYGGEFKEAFLDYVENELDDYVGIPVEEINETLEQLKDLFLEGDPENIKIPDDGNTGLVKIVDSDEEGEGASLVIATEKDKEEEEKTVMSELKVKDPEVPELEELLVPLPEGKWDIDVVDQDGDEDAVEVEVEAGTDTVAHVDTTPVPEFYVTRSVISQTDSETDYRVTAHVKGITSPITLTISVQNAALMDTATKTLTEDGSVSWNFVRVLSQNGQVTVTRNDTGESYLISLPAGGVTDYGLSVWASPASPGAGQRVYVYGRVSPADAGVVLNFQVSGTDGYSQNVNRTTGSDGTASTSIPGAAAGVRDTITVTVVNTGHSRTFSYTFR